MCHSPKSFPIENASSRPSALCPTAISLKPNPPCPVKWVPICDHRLHAPLDVCQLCQGAQLPPTMQASRMPFAFKPVATCKMPLIEAKGVGAPSEAQPLQPVVLDQSCHTCQREFAEPVKDTGRLSAAKISNLMSAFCPAAINSKPFEKAMPVGLPSENQLLQPVAVDQSCHMCFKSPAGAAPNTSKRPSPFRPTTMLTEAPPNENQLLQPLLGAVCQICESAPKASVAKTSNRPSPFCPTAISCTAPPSVDHVLQPVPVCQMCRRLLSDHLPKTSSRPFAFLPTAIIRNLLRLGFPRQSL